MPEVESIQKLSGIKIWFNFNNKNKKLTVYYLI